MFHCQPKRREIIASSHPVVFSWASDEQPLPIKRSNLGKLFTQPTAAGIRVNDLQPGMLNERVCCLMGQESPWGRGCGERGESEVMDRPTCCRRKV